MLNLSLYRLTEFSPAVFRNSEETVCTIYGCIEKKLLQINCVISIVKLHSSTAHRYASSDYLSRVYVISSAKVACKYFQGSKKFERWIELFSSLFLCTLNQKV